MSGIPIPTEELRLRISFVTQRPNVADDWSLRRPLAACTIAWIDVHFKYERCRCTPWIRHRSQGTSSDMNPATSSSKMPTSGSEMVANVFDSADAVYGVIASEPASKPKQSKHRPSPFHMLRAKAAFDCPSRSPRVTLCKFRCSALADTAI